MKSGVLGTVEGTKLATGTEDELRIEGSESGSRWSDPG